MLATLGAIVVFALGLHWGSLGHQLVFDDAFAIIRNKDVLGTSSWSELLAHDFWGQRMISATSHKSYRPLTVGIWRLLHRLQGGDTPNARWFHVLNLVAHSVVSVQMFFFGRQLFIIFEQPYPGWRGVMAALLFASHPVHSEAVVGAVGFAELLCASLGIMAMQVLLFPEDGIPASQLGIRSCMATSCRACIGSLFVFGATFAKEVGITAFGTVVLWDLMVVPLLRALRHKRQAISCDSIDSCSGDTPEDKTCDQSEPPAAPIQSSQVNRFREQVAIVFRIIGSMMLVWFYKYQVRQRIAGGQDLVRNYRRAENPFPFAPTRLCQVLSVIANHAHYAKLLVFPKDLSCDWSFACTSYVMNFSDVRNLQSLALYGYLITLIFRASPGRILRRLFGEVRALQEDDKDAVLQAFLVYGLIIVPFLPASNIFFWVGTAVGERLLYYPSIGYVLLLADVLGPNPSGTIGKSAAPSSRVRSCWRKLLGLLRVLMVLGIVGAFSWRTMDRVPDWKDEDVLFQTAYKVCPTAVKVLQNLGIDSQRHSLDKALKLFRTARRIDPMLCDLGYLEGETLLRKGAMEEGLPHIREAAKNCPTRRDAGIQVLASMVEDYNVKTATEEKIGLMKDLALGYLNPDNGLAGQGCDLMEQVAWGWILSDKSGHEDMSLKKLRGEVRKAYAACEKRLKEFCDARFSNVSASQQPLQCFQERAAFAQLYVKTKGPGTITHKVRSKEVAEAAYKYIKTASRLGCLVSPTSIDDVEAELCGAQPTRLHGISPFDRVVGISPAGKKVTVSTGHRFLVHVAQMQDEYDPWMQQAWGEVLVWEGRHEEASRHVKVAAQMIAAAYEGNPAGNNGGVPRVDYLKVACAPAHKDLPALFRKWWEDGEQLSKPQQPIGHTKGKAAKKRALPALPQQADNKIKQKAKRRKKAVTSGSVASSDAPAPPPAKRSATGRGGEKPPAPPPKAKRRKRRKS